MKRPKNKNRKVIYIKARGRWEGERFIFDKPLVCQAHQRYIVVYPKAPVPLSMFTVQLPEQRDGPLSIFETGIFHKKSVQFGLLEKKDPYTFTTDSPFETLIIDLENKNSETPKTS
jgi:hypothetical protein